MLMCFGFFLDAPPPNKSGPVVYYICSSGSWLPFICCWRGSIRRYSLHRMLKVRLHPLLLSIQRSHFRARCLEPAWQKSTQLRVQHLSGWAPQILNFTGFSIQIHCILVVAAWLTFRLSLFREEQDGCDHDASVIVGVVIELSSSTLHTWFSWWVLYDFKKSSISLIGPAVCENLLIKFLGLEIKRSSKESTKVPVRIAGVDTVLVGRGTVSWAQQFLTQNWRNWILGSELKDVSRCFLHFSGLQGGHDRVQGKVLLHVSHRAQNAAWFRLQELILHNIGIVLFSPFLGIPGNSSQYNMGCSFFFLFSMCTCVTLKSCNTKIFPGKFFKDQKNNHKGSH